MNKIIPFSPPDITELEINEVIDTLKSGWITTGPKTKIFEEEISKYCNVEKTLCVNSATAGLELVLRLFDIGNGDEVITTPYTYCATSNIILHTGAKPVFVDIKPNTFHIDPINISKAINKKTKAIITVDYGGYPCDYNEIFEILKNHKSFYNPKKGSLQEYIDRPLVIADAAHAFGAKYYNKNVGSIADFTVFSFHAVKNLTTAEGGAITFNSINSLSSEEIYKKLKLLSLHGQNKDAFDKFKAGGWQYDIELPGYKYNMTDIQAALGLAQLKRYNNEILPKRENIYKKYIENLSNTIQIILPPFNDENKNNCFHLFPIRIKDIQENDRNKIIQEAASSGISLNVHFIPVVMHSAYKKLGYNIKDFPNTYNQYINEISLPIYSKLNIDDVNFICDNLIRIISKI